MATYIKTLLEYSTGDTIYPKTKSDAVYRTDNVTVAETTLAAADTHIANTNNPHNVTATQLNVYTKTEIDNAGYLTSIPKASSSVLGGIKIGSGLTISSGGVVSVTGGGVADSVAWGHITGTLADQTDLNNILSTIPTNVSDLPNDAGYITGITSSDVTNALGYTPYSSANPNGYTSNIGTITSVKTTAGTHNTINVTSGSVSFNVPTKTSHLNNDSGFITTETDPVFTASAASEITSSDITNWNTKSFKITVTENNGTYTADKTYAEVESAINAGYICYIFYEPYYYYYTMYLPGEGYYFELISVASYRTYFCYMSDGTLFSASETIVPNFSATSPIAVMGSSTVTYYLQDNYGDTKNPYASKTKNYVLAAPSTANGAPSFRALVATDIPTLTISKISDFPTNVSSFTNDAGYLTSDATWNGVSLTKSSSAGYSGYVPFMSDTTSTSMSLRQMSDSPSSGRIAVYNSSNYLITTTPTAGDNSTKAATTAFVATAISGKADSATTLAGYGITDAKISNGTITLGSNTITPSTTDEKLKATSASNNTTYYPIFGTSTSDAETKFKDTIGFKYITKSTGEAMITLGNDTSGASNSRYGVLELYGTTTYSTILTSGAPTAARTISLPNKSGTIALTDDIPDISNKADKATTLAGYGITDAKISNGTITLGSNTITPLTSFTETDPVFVASAAHGITSSDITNWNGKVSSTTTSKIFVQSATPTGMQEGDIWIDIS